MMNIKDKVYTEYIGLRVTKEEYDLLFKTLCRKKKDKLSVKLREYIFSSIKEEPVIEYKITQDEGITGVVLYEGGEVKDNLFFDNIGDAMGYVRSVNAVKRVC